MHTGEEFFNWGWAQFLLIGLIFASYITLSFANKLPGMGAFKDFADTINTAGGHIILLSLLSVWSIKIAMQFFYHLLGLPPSEFDKSSSIITSGITFVQGSLCGTFIGALIKTMSGGKAVNGGGGVPPEQTILPADSNSAQPSFPVAVPGPEAPKT